MSILLTKVRQPQRRKDILRRVRLVDSIHQNIHRKLTFVSAPAGYGKTTLLVDFASDVDANVCWYLISPDDKDLVQFIRHILAAFQQQFPGFGSELEQSLNLASGSPNGVSIAIDLINEIETKIDDFTVLVLDDYHLAGENEEIVEFIEKLIEYLPDQLRILIGSRSVYGIPTANLYIRDELVTISADELRFRADELQKLVLQNYHVKLSREQAEDFAKRADGWIVAILLALRSMDTQGSIPKLTGGTEKLYEYLAEEVVNRQSPDLRDFMYSTSLLGDFNEELANYVREKQDSSDYLQRLEERNLFVTRTEDTDGYSYRYHQLFSEFLQEQFEKHDSRRLLKLHSRAADWHKERQEWEAAIQHKLDAKEHEEAAKWIDDISSYLYTAGRQNEISRWYRKLDLLGNARRNAPHLAMYQAKILGQQHFLKESSEILDYCEPELISQKDNVALANVLVTKGMLKRSNQEYTEAKIFANEAIDLLSSVEDGNEKRHQLHQAERLKAIALNAQGYTEESFALLETAIAGFRSLRKNSSGYEQQRYTYDLAELLSDYGLLSIMAGELLAARQSFEEALEIHKKTGGDRVALALGHNNIAYVFQISGRYKEAWQHYELGLRHAQSSNKPRGKLPVLNGQASILIDLNELDLAEELLKEAITLAYSYGDKVALKESQKTMANVYRLKGKHSEAMNFLRDAFSHEGEDLFSASYYLNMAKNYMDMNHPDLANEQLGILSELIKKPNIDKEIQIESDFLKFRISYMHKDYSKAIEQLESSFKTAAHIGYDHFLIVAAKSAIEELKQIQKDISNPQLDDFVKRVENFQLGKSALDIKEKASAELKFHLEIKSLGSTQIYIDGEIIPNSAWRSNRARALFYYLVDNGQARKDSIGIDFWPEFSPGKMSSNFHATLWRVRSALSNPKMIVFENGNYSLNSDINIWYDANEFEDYIKEALTNREFSSEWVESFRQAINLYRGEYLPGVYMDWVDLRRNELEKKYLNALHSLAQFELSKDNFRQARELFENVLSIDPYRDQIHLELMECLTRSGKNDQAKKHFQDYKELLRRELNSDPLPNLQKFYDQLLA